ncbi:MAG: hypothetical protein H6867_09205 [Rhodospirillales bacterium]|nr:hypothetical protein [Rhodospirillales bacterium]MCB9996022.1 hypothetical protein [Rhodospirillales bacterium]
MLAAIFNAFSSAERRIADCGQALSRAFRQWGLHEAANVAERHFRLPSLQSVKAFHMPTVGARRKDDPVRLQSQGRFVYRDPFYRCTRIHAQYDDSKAHWTVTRQSFAAYRSQIENGVHSCMGKSEQFTFQSGQDALAHAEKLFEQALYSPNPGSMPRAARQHKCIVDDTHPAGSTMHHIVRRIEMHTPPGPSR